MQFGLKRALLFSVAGYLMAWASEFSSIHNGFPYGLYYYIERTRGMELWASGVPFMDSLSYVFLAYASYSTALLAVSPLLLSDGGLYLLDTARLRHGGVTRLLAAVLFVYLDIIIDAVALRGDRWFLGLIYGYPDGGAYFGIPISNFIGWFVTGFFMIWAFQGIDRALWKRRARDIAGYAYGWRFWPGPVLYLAVLLFNLSVTFYIGEYNIGWAGVFITLLPLVLIYAVGRSRLSDVSARAIEEHMRDFPEARVKAPQTAS